MSYFKKKLFIIVLLSLSYLDSSAFAKCEGDFVGFRDNNELILWNELSSSCKESYGAPFSLPILTSSEYNDLKKSRKSGNFPGNFLGSTDPSAKVLNNYFKVIDHLKTTYKKENNFLDTIQNFLNKKGSPQTQVLREYQQKSWIYNAQLILPNIFECKNVDSFIDEVEKISKTMQLKKEECKEERISVGGKVYPVIYSGDGSAYYVFEKQMTKGTVKKVFEAVKLLPRENISKYVQFKPNGSQEVSSFLDEFKNLQLLQDLKDDDGRSIASTARFAKMESICRFDGTDNSVVGWSKKLDGSMFDMILKNKKKKKKFNYSEVIKLALPIAETIKNLHNSGMAHLDLKPENILYKKSYSYGKNDERGFYIGDLDTLNKIINCKEGEFCGGTAGFVPPEALALNVDAKAQDVFALGITLYLLAMNKTRNEIPFGEFKKIDFPHLKEDTRYFIMQIENDLSKKKRNTKSKVKKAFYQLIENMIAQYPEERMSIGDVYKNLKQLDRMSVEEYYGGVF
ncbi:MAG: protein kinase [Oligoflexia bacterium]|nr:protein kinase [Oligoflexia bacterium]